MLTRTLFTLKNTRSITTSTLNKVTAEALDISRKDDYYKKLGAQMDLNSEMKPEGWEEAKPFEEVPGPKAIPVLGNLWRFFPFVGEYYNVSLVNFHKMLRDKYGDILVLKGLPNAQDLVCVYKTDDIQNILRNEGAWPVRRGLPSFLYYRTVVRKDLFQGVGGVLTVLYVCNGFLSEDTNSFLMYPTIGEDWFKFRSIVNPILMQPRTAQQYVSKMDEVASELIENMKHFAKHDRKKEMPDNFLNELYKWTMESMGVIAFDKRLGCLDLELDADSEPQKMINAVNEMFNLMFELDVMPSLWRYVSTPAWRRYVKVLDYISETNMKHIEEGLSRAEEYKDKPEHETSVLLRLAKIDKKVALTMTMDMMIAGIDTTGRTMAAALYYLATNPDKQECLRRELKKFLPNKNSTVTKQMLNESLYLKAVIKETTRLAPIAVGNLRETIKDMVLSGYKIPKSTGVITMNLYLAKEEKHFKNADKFIPERWLRTTTDEMSYKNVDPFVYLPFGFGPRSCIGKRLANLELEVGLAKTIRNFQLSWERKEMRFDSKLLYGVEDPVKIKVEELNS